MRDYSVVKLESINSESFSMYRMLGDANHVLPHYDQMPISMLITSPYKAKSDFLHDDSLTISRQSILKDLCFS